MDRHLDMYDFADDKMCIVASDVDDFITLLTTTVAANQIWYWRCGRGGWRYMRSFPPFEFLYAQCALVERYPDGLRWIASPGDMTCETALAADGMAVRHLDIARRTAHALAAVRAMGHAVQYIHDADETVCTAAASHTAYALHHMSVVTHAVALAAIQQNPRMAILLIHNPSRDLQTEALQFEYYREYVSTSALELMTHTKPKVAAMHPGLTDVQRIRVLAIQPSTFRHMRSASPEVQCAAVAADPENIRYITNPTHDMIHAACTARSYILGWFERPPFSVIADVLDTDPYAYRYVGSDYRHEVPVVIWRRLMQRIPTTAYIFGRYADETTQISVVRYNGLLIEHFPRPTENVQLIAVTQNPYAALHVVPAQYLAESAQTLAVQTMPELIGQWPDASYNVQMAASVADPEVFLLAYTGVIDPAVASYVSAAAPKRYADTQAMCSMPDDAIMCAVRNDGNAIECIYDDVMNEQVPTQIIRAAVSQNGLALEHVPEADITCEVALDAVKQNGLALRWVPETQRTSRVVTAALSRAGPDAFEWLDDPSPAYWHTAARYDPLATAMSASTIDQTDPVVAMVNNVAAARNGHALQYMRAPTTEQRLAAVRQNGNAVRWITRPTLEEARAAVESAPEAVEWIEPDIYSDAWEYALSQHPELIDKYPAGRVPSLKMLAIVAAASSDLRALRSSTAEIYTSGRLELSLSVRI